METLLSLFIVLALLAGALVVLAHPFGGGGRRGQPSRIAFRVARWVLMAALVLTLMPLLLLIVLGIWLLSPKGRVWTSYWGHVLANATTGVWHWMFGPPKVKIHRSHNRRGLRRNRRFDNRWN
ncbi:MAG: hypothetical protein IH623_06430 [Verrucomicrobia bacterium]|nr:hypothetical protein [Verrucomicrobiota bacterium]